MPELFDVNVLSPGITANGWNINFPSTSGTFALVSDVASVSGALDLVLSKTKEPNGFENFTDSKLMWVDATRTFSISGNYYVWIAGQRFKKTFETYTIPNVSGNYYFYYNSSNTFTATTSAWNVTQDVPICYVTWFGSKGIAYEERHGITMDSITHQYLHKTRGTQYVSGLSLNNFTLDSISLVDVQFSVDPGLIADEDISFNIPNITGGAYTILRKAGPNGDWILSTDNVIPMLGVGGDIEYNNFNGSQWVMTPLTTNNVYVNYYVVATTAISAKYNIFLIPGQQFYTTIPEAQGEVYTALDLTNFPIQETVLLHRVMYERKNTYPTTTARSVIKQTAKITQNTSIQTLAGTVPQHNGLIGLQGGSVGEYYHLTANQYSNLVTMASISGAYVPNSGNSSISGTKTFEDPVIINDTLSSAKYLLGSDLSLIPVVGGQSAISTWWGMQLVGNQQVDINYTPANIGGAGDYGIIIPTQTPTISSAVMNRASVGQTADFNQWQDSSGVVLSEIRANGNFNGNVDYVPSVSGNWIIQPNTLSQAVEELSTSWFSNKRIILQDDFIFNAVPTTTPQGPAGFTADTANGGSLAITAAPIGHIGVINLNTGTTNNNTGRGALSLGTASVQPTGIIIYEALVRFPVLSNATVEYTGLFGCSDTQSATPNNGIYFLYDRLNAGSDVWRICTAAGGSRTLTNTAVAVTPLTWYKIKFVANLNPTKRIDYYIDNNYIASITTNIPVLTTGFRAQMLKTSSTTTSRAAQVDYINIAIDFPAR